MHSMDETAHLLEAANLHRAVGSHNLNEHSSRSHAICTLQMEQRLRPGAAPGPDAPRFLRSKLHLVDLAGEHVARFAYPPPGNFCIIPPAQTAHLVVQSWV